VLTQLFLSIQSFLLTLLNHFVSKVVRDLFSCAYYKIYACFERKTAFIMQNFRNLGASGGGMALF